MLLQKVVHNFFFFGPGSIPVLRSGLGSPANRSIILDNVVCSGRESNLTECEYSTTNNCDRSEEAGVRCEGEMEADMDSGFVYFSGKLLC